MNSTSPLVSIGMPIHNEGQYLRESLACLEAQDLGALEILICDNASTDTTSQICQEYAAQDQRIHYERNSENVGSIENFNRTFRRSTGRYFMWASGHDLWHPSLLTRCVEVLEQDPTVVLCYPHSERIDAVGQPLPWEEFAHFDTRNVGTVMRVASVLSGIGNAYMMYGVIRSDALGKTRLLRVAMQPDNILMAELAFFGAFAEIPDILCQFRMKWGEESKSQLTERVFTMMDPRKKHALMAFPYSTWIIEQLRAIYQADVSLVVKSFLFFWVFFGYIARYRSKLPPALRRSLRRHIGQLTRIGW